MFSKKYVLRKFFSCEGVMKKKIKTEESVKISGGNGERDHLYPYRTQKLSLSALMVLGWRRPGRVSRRRNLYENRFYTVLFFYVNLFIIFVAFYFKYVIMVLTFFVEKIF